jgi:hypothetical protein
MRDLFILVAHLIKGFFDLRDPEGYAQLSQNPF